MRSGNESYPHLILERVHGIFNSHSLVHELQRHPCSSPLVGQLSTPPSPVWVFKVLGEALLLSLQIVVLCRSLQDTLHQSQVQAVLIILVKTCTNHRWCTMMTILVVDSGNGT